MGEHCVNSHQWTGESSLLFLFSSNRQFKGWTRIKKSLQNPAPTRYDRVTHVLSIFRSTTLSLSHLHLSRRTSLSISVLWDPGPGSWLRCIQRRQMTRSTLRCGGKCFVLHVEWRRSVFVLLCFIRGVCKTLCIYPFPFHVLVIVRSDQEIYFALFLPQGYVYYFTQTIQISSHIRKRHTTEMNIINIHINVFSFLCLS